ncbi:hypothetical protein GCM10022198_19450 [Klugiella xanthotipulae]|uniref:Transmembrane protein DUF3566 n=1 Tax=Klugiella xanthotipulae TaxID=244735 RepID=A0A543I6Z1_9MICO|nr:DUF3566 domain-containing protein [Klugiella xanthotipulae]TQM66321.1 transmembrane protein DUF3566 [Klugiella xanthotipulae]
MSNSVADKLASKSRKKTPAKQVRLKLVYVDFWSAVKFSFLLSLSTAIVLIVATFLVYMVLNQTGIFERINKLFMDIVTGDDLNLMNILGIQQVMGFAIVVAVLNVIIGTALGAISAVIYNLIVKVTGGFQLGFTSN